MLRLAVEPRRLRRIPGVRFAKLLGTGSGDSFGPGDADLTRWAAVVVTDGDDIPLPAFDAIADAAAWVDLVPVSSRGTWSGQQPFGAGPWARARSAARVGRGAGTVEGGDGSRVPEDLVLALTRARLRPAKAASFWRAVPAVAAELHAAPGLLARFGVGEAPIGWQGTVSVWRSAADLTAFAYRQPEHRAVIARTPGDRWYAEELFARFTVRGIGGDPAVLGWREGERR